MLTGILSLLEAANKIYRVPYVDKILMSIQVANFLKNFENFNNDYHITVAITFTSLLLYWIASPILTAIAVITPMVYLIRYNCYDSTSLRNAALLVFFCSVIQFTIPYSGPNILYSLYSIVSQNNFLESLYMNIKEKSIQQDNDEITNSDTFLHCLSTCIHLVFLDASIKAKMLISATTLLVTYNRIKHAYCHETPLFIATQKICNNHNWLTDISIEQLVRATPLSSLFSTEAIKLGSAAVSCAFEPEDFRPKSHENK